jgi:uncharacterized membrane protein YGL010W
MRNLTDQLAQYAEYHRDTRNIATHFVGIPMIVLALAVLLSRPVLSGAGWPLAAVPLSPAWLLFGASTLYYLVLDVPLGIMMAVVAALCLTFGAWLAQQGTALWLAGGIGLFLVGWVFQFIGHVAYEHRKPAFVDDLVGLVIGPIFVLAEALFALGWRPALLAAIEARAGRTHINPPREHAAR